jgi:hypothetical protein
MAALHMHEVRRKSSFPEESARIVRSEVIEVFQ